MASVVIIWIMVVWLVYEATCRIIHPDFEIEASIMIITAFISLGCNIFSLVVLGHFPLPCGKGKGAHGHGENFMDGVTSIYKPHGGHSCGHDHGPGGHDHDHGHDHGSGQCQGHSHEHKHDDQPET